MTVEYKCVALPTLEKTKDELQTQAVMDEVQRLLNEHARDGWLFVGQETFVLDQRTGLFGKGKTRQADAKVLLLQRELHRPPSAYAEPNYGEQAHPPAPTRPARAPVRAPEPARFQEPARAQEPVRSAPPATEPSFEPPSEGMVVPAVEDEHLSTDGFGPPTTISSRGRGGPSPFGRS